MTKDRKELPFDRNSYELLRRNSYQLINKETEMTEHWKTIQNQQSVASASDLLNEASPKPVTPPWLREKPTWEKSAVAGQEAHRSHVETACELYATLLEENAKLREEIQDLRSSLHSIHSAAENSLKGC